MARLCKFFKGGSEGALCCLDAGVVIMKKYAAYCHAAYT